MNKTYHTSLPASNAAYSSVHLTYLITELVKTTTKVSLHPLKLLHNGLEGHTTSNRGRRSRKGWNSRSCRIGHLHLWLFRSKLSLTSLDRTSTDSTHDGEERKERKGNVKVLKDPHNSRRKDELIMSSGILIHIYNRCDEVRRKVERKILYQGKKKTSMRLGDGVIMRPWSESKGYHHVQKS